MNNNSIGRLSPSPTINANTNNNSVVNSRNRKTIHSFESSSTSSSTSTGSFLINGQNHNNFVHPQLNEDTLENNHLDEEETEKNYYINAYLDNISDVYYENNINTLDKDFLEQLDTTNSSNQFKEKDSKFTMRFLHILHYSTL